MSPGGKRIQLFARIRSDWKLNGPSPCLEALKLIFFCASFRWSNAPRQRHNRTPRNAALFVPE